MPIDETVIQCLRELDTRQTWQFDELPRPVTDDVLRDLGDAGLINIRSYIAGWYPSTGRGEWTKWYWPNEDPTVGGEWPTVLAQYGRGSEHPLEIRVAKEGKSKLADLAILTAAVPAEKRNGITTRTPNGGIAGDVPPAATAAEAVTRLCDEWATTRQLASVMGKSDSAIRSALKRAKDKKKFLSADEQSIPDSRPGMPKIRYRIRGVWRHLPK